MKLLIVLTAVCSPLIVVYGIWRPVLIAFAIHDPELPDEIVTLSRLYPDATTVEALASIGVVFGLGEQDYKKPLSRVETAEDLLRGEVNIEGYPRRKIQMPFDSQAVFQGSSPWQLAYASFLIPKIFLHAFTTTGKSEFLKAGLDFIFGWADFERDNWNLESFVWNDHAAAARGSVLADYWYYYKTHDSFTIEGGRKLLKMAARTTDFLARDINYTFRTNHGTMQSIAVLEMVVFFPKIESIQKAKQPSIDNLIEQFKYFINSEGIVLEHSAGYHAFGLKLFEASLRLFQVLGVNIPGDWAEKYDRGLKFLAALRRPDGSLPKLGDTSGPAGSAGRHLRPDREFTFAPGAGYSIWWSGLESWPESRKLSQLAATWSSFPFMGHKHADELSFILWKGGQEWWTNVGYWPYIDKRRKRAVTWSGSNAPHLIGETWDSVRRSFVLARSDNERIKAIDLVRRRPDGFRARRQILCVGDSVWITLDSFEDTSARRVRAVWGLHPSLIARELDSPGTFRVFGEQTDLVMDVLFKGSDGIGVRKVHGSDDPIAGWMVAGGVKVLPADAIIVDQDTNQGWVAAVSVFGARGIKERTVESVDVRWSGPEQWTLTIARQQTVLTVQRYGGSVLVTGAPAAGSITKVRMEAVSEKEQSQREIEAAYLEAEMKHGRRFLPLVVYRGRVTAAVAVLFLINMSGIIICLNFFRRKTLPLSILSICLFGLLYFWLMNYYFVI